MIWSCQTFNVFGWKSLFAIKKTINRPPNSTNVTWSATEDSVGLAFDTNIQNILLTGDFNLDALKETSNKKLRDSCQQFNF